MTTAVPLPAQRPLVLADVLGRSRTRDIALVVTAALFTAALAQIAIPVPGSPVPITGQTLAVVLTAAALGPHRGLAGQALYLTLGAIGLPFYSEASGGFEVISGATGGYIVGFLPAAYLIGLAAKHQLDRALWKALPLFVAGQAIIFAVGVPWLAVTAHLDAGQAIAAGFTPFIVGGLIKAAVAGAILPGLWKLTKRS